MNPQSYGSGNAFRIALEARLKDRAAAEDIDLQRLRRRVAFDRFLSRLVDSRIKVLTLRALQPASLHMGSK